VRKFVLVGGEGASHALAALGFDVIVRADGLRGRTPVSICENGLDRLGGLEAAKEVEAVLLGSLFDEGLEHGKRRWNGNIESGNLGRIPGELVAYSGTIEMEKNGAYEMGAQRQRCDSRHPIMADVRARKIG
jgi:hypothetical protein